MEADAPSTSTTTTQPLTKSGYPQWEYQLPHWFCDNLPDVKSLIPAMELPTHQPDPYPVRWVILIVRDRLITVLNTFGIWREYLNRPTIDLDATLTLEDLSNSHQKLTQGSHFLPAPNSSLESNCPFYWPFPNSTVHSIMKSLNNGKTVKSESEITTLVCDDARTVLWGEETNTINTTNIL